jgi:hypothetical protein
LTPHELAAPAIHEVMDGGMPVFLEETDEISVDAIATAIDQLAEDWRIDVDYEVQGYRVALLHAGRRPDTLYDQEE